MVPNMELPSGNECTTRPWRCCRKPRQPKHGGCENILERWDSDDKYRQSLSENVWTEEQITQYDELALEDHSYIATREERTRNEKSWVLSLSKAGRRPMSQRPDLAEAQQKC